MKTQIKVSFNYSRWNDDYYFDRFIDAFNFAAMWGGEIIISKPTPVCV